MRRLPSPHGLPPSPGRVWTGDGPTLRPRVDSVVNEPTSPDGLGDPSRPMSPPSATGWDQIRSRRNRRLGSDQGTEEISVSQRVARPGFWKARLPEATARLSKATARLGRREARLPGRISRLARRTTRLQKRTTRLTRRTARLERRTARLARRRTRLWRRASRLLRRIRHDSLGIAPPILFPSSPWRKSLSRSGVEGYRQNYAQRPAPGDRSI